MTAERAPRVLHGSGMIRIASDDQRRPVALTMREVPTDDAMRRLARVAAIIERDREAQRVEVA